MQYKDSERDRDRLDFILAEVKMETALIEDKCHVSLIYEHYNGTILCAGIYVLVS